MSTITCVAWVAITVIAPPTPAGTIAAFATTVPVGAFSVEDPGCGSPAGHTLRKPSGADGTTVMLSAYACAPAGIPQPLATTGKFRCVFAGSDGPPKVPAAPR